MFRPNARRSLLLVAVLSAGLAAGPTAAVTMPPGSSTPNIRPFFGVGYSTPLRFGDFDRGFGLGAGFEIEQSPRVSLLWRVEWHVLESERSPSYPPYPIYPLPATRFERIAVNWALGVRAHLPTLGAVRPHAEICYGVRLADFAPDASGVAVTLRLGLSTARPGGAGLFLDSGLEFVDDKPERNAIVPVRLGVVFP